MRHPLYAIPYKVVEAYVLDRYEPARREHRLSFRDTRLRVAPQRFALFRGHRFPLCWGSPEYRLRDELRGAEVVVDAGVKNLEHHRILREDRGDPKLQLGVVELEPRPPRRRDEEVLDELAELVLGSRNILEIRIRGRQTPGVVRHDTARDVAVISLDGEPVRDAWGLYLDRDDGCL